MANKCEKYSDLLIIKKIQTTVGYLLFVAGSAKISKYPRIVLRSTTSKHCFGVANGTTMLESNLAICVEN